MKRKSAGFTIAEVLVSIAVLAISITGVLAALAYDAFSTEQSGAYTFAVNYSRRVMDLLQSGQIDPSLPGFITATTPAAIDSNPGNDGTNWRDLDAGFLGSIIPNLWGAPNSVERRRFDNEKQRYGVNLAQQPLVSPPLPNNGPNNYRANLVRLVVTTRWRQRQSFRFIRLEGYYATAAAP